MKNSFVKGLITGALIETLLASAVVYATDSVKTLMDTDEKATRLLYFYDEDKASAYDLDKSGNTDVLDMVKLKRALLNPYGTYYSTEGNAIEGGASAGGVAFSPNDITVNNYDCVSKVAISFVLKLIAEDYDFWNKTDFPTASINDFSDSNVSIRTIDHYTVREFKEAFGESEWFSKVTPNEQLSDDSKLTWIRFRVNCMEKDGYFGTYNESGEYIPYTAKLIEVVYG